jgi:hypothetical protein
MVTDAYGVFDYNGVADRLVRVSSQMGFVPSNTHAAGASWHLASIANNRFDFTNQEATIAVWCRRVTATPGGASDAGFCLSWTSNENSSATLYPWTDGNLYCSLFDTGGRPINGAALLSSVNRADWHLVSFSTKAGTNNYRFYQNGMLAAQATRTTFSATTGGTVYLMGGRGEFGINRWYGQACDFRVWNRAFNDDEHADLFHAAMRWDLYEQPPAVAYFDMGGGGGGGGGSTFPALTVAI